MERYVVRREFFGGLVYDRIMDTNIMIDEEFFNALNQLQKINTNELLDVIDKILIAGFRRIYKR